MVEDPFASPRTADIGATQPGASEADDRSAARIRLTASWLLFFGVVIGLVAFTQLRMGIEAWPRRADHGAGALIAGGVLMAISTLQVASGARLWVWDKRA